MQRESALLQIDRLLAENFGAETFTPGLSRIQYWIDHYQLAPRAKIVTIAGTNGKGETTNALGHLMKSARQSFCQWTSPHILAITERFISHQGQIEAEVLLGLVNHWLGERPKHPQARLSYFEFLFVVFLDWHRQVAPDYLLLEVGLGGRLDAVNALDADVVVLTSISRDHQEILGNSYRKILSEKLGVLRPSARLFSHLELAFLRQHTRALVERLGCAWTELSLEHEAGGKSGDFSSVNQTLAKRAFQALTGLAPMGLESFHYRNRFVEMLGSTEVHLFGSHNTDGLRKLVQFLGQHHYNKYDVILLSFSKRDDRDLVTMLRTIAPLAPEIWVSTFSHAKAVEFESLKQLLDGKIKGRLEFVRDYKTALQSISRAPKKILVTGSYYFIAEVVACVRGLGTGDTKE